jgi:zinc/manganese transport system permease protein
MELTMLQFLAAPFVASLILTGIHAYLGVHVVERGVIFVDLSLAQIAALGATMALLMPISLGDPHAPVVYWISLGFTFIGAAVFSMIRTRRARIPQEAIIGISYAVASAAAILAMSKSTSQAEHLKDMLVGNIIAVSWDEVLRTAVLYGIIGAFHYVFRSKFLAISINPQRAEAAGISLRFWDFLFYASFGFVVTSSVAIAGVLLVFCYLIVPSVAAMLFADRIGPRLAIGWSMGTIVSALGVYLSLVLDLPTGATIVCTFGLVLVVLALVRLMIPGVQTRDVRYEGHDMHERLATKATKGLSHEGHEGLSHEGHEGHEGKTRKSSCSSCASWLNVFVPFVADSSRPDRIEPALLARQPVRRHQVQPCRVFRFETADLVQQPNLFG